MKFYMKNPAVEHVTVQGKEMGKDTVVCGDEFAPFADPTTFSGWTPKLIEVPFEKLTDDQKVQARGVAEETANKPPRHLGVITSENISHPEGKFKISTAADVSKADRDKLKKKGNVQPSVRGPEKPPEDEKKDKVTHAVVTEDEIVETFDKKLPKLSEMYTAETFSETFPGVTPKNAAKVLTGFLTLDELGNASNAELRKTGIRANFFDRLRKKADVEKKAFEDEKG